MSLSSMTENNAIIVQFPEELASMEEKEVGRALQGIDRELATLQQEKLELLKQRRLLEMFQMVMFPDLFPEWRSIAMTVQARLRRARELKAGTGETKNEELRLVAELPTQKKRLNFKQMSKCCSVGTFDGERHAAGDRYCGHCGKACVWISNKFPVTSG